MSHPLQLHKLSSLSLDESIYHWIENYLSGRKQCVVINGASSDLVDVTSGVPQGSVLGPLLFLVFINDISSTINSPIRLFADDCVLYSRVDSVGDSAFLQSDLDKISDWCRIWELGLNVEKCVQVIFGRKRNPVPSCYFIDDHRLSNNTDVKYLGITLSSTLSFNVHVTETAKKASRTLNLFIRSLRGAPQKLKETAYCCLVRPTLEYACVLWDPHQKYLADKLEKLQNRAARFVTGNYSRNNSVTVTKNGLGWETLLSRRKDFRLRFLLAIFNDMTGIDKSNYIELPNYISNRVDHTRKIREISCRTDYKKFSFFPRTSLFEIYAVLHRN